MVQGIFYQPGAPHEKQAASLYAGMHSQSLLEQGKYSKVLLRTGNESHLTICY